MNYKKGFLLLGIMLLIFCSISKAQFSPAHTLAILDNGGFIRANTEFVQKYERVMNQLDRKFSENKNQIADMTVKVIDLLKEIDVNQTNLNIMLTINSVSSPKRTYNVYVAYYLTYRQQGYSHDASRRALLNL